MESIDVSDLPEPVARGFEILVEMARKMTGHTNGQQVPQRAVRDGTVYGTLSRKEIYEDNER